MPTHLTFRPSQALSWPWCPQLHQQQKPRSVHLHRQKPQMLPPNQVKENSDMLPSPVWLPAAPPITKPRASYNAASLAYLGDCVYELYVRCHFLSPPQSIEKYNTHVMGLVCCEAQDILLKTLLKDNFLSDEERDVVRWGKNVQTNSKRATKRAGAAVYSRASSLETLIGYLYLTNQNRLQELMNHLGLTSNDKVNLAQLGGSKSPNGKDLGVTA